MYPQKGEEQPPVNTQTEKTEKCQDFLLNYYTGHIGQFGHEYLEFQFRSDGKLKYYNSTEYKKQSMIRKEVHVTDTVLEEVRKIIVDSEILKESDSLWPQPDKVGKQQLKVEMNGKSYHFKTSKIVTYSEVQKSKDPDGLTVFFYLVQDLKCLVFSLVNLHFRIKPV